METLGHHPTAIGFMLKFRQGLMFLQPIRTVEENA